MRIGIFGLSRNRISLLYVIDVGPINLLAGTLAKVLLRTRFVYRMLAATLETALDAVQVLETCPTQSIGKSLGRQKGIG